MLMLDPREEAAAADGLAGRFGDVRRRRPLVFARPSSRVSTRDFVILEELYRSQAGAVYKARRRRSAEVVVLKERRCAELGRRRDMMHEVQLLQQLDHPNVVRCFGSFWDEAKIALLVVLEFAPGGDLHELLERRKVRAALIPEAWITVAAFQMASGVRHLHEHGVVHRDVKALNILVGAAPHDPVIDEDGAASSSSKRGGGAAGGGGALPVDPKLKIADLGVSRQVGEETLFLKTMYGTPLYASPEVCEGKPYNEKVDIWSLGVVLYELAALRHPFVAQSLLELANAIKRGAYDPIPPAYSARLRANIASMLQRDVDRRPPITDVLASFGGTLSGHPSPSPTSSANKRDDASGATRRPERNDAKKKENEKEEEDEEEDAPLLLVLPLRARDENPAASPAPSTKMAPTGLLSSRPATTSADPVDSNRRPDGQEAPPADTAPEDARRTRRKLEARLKRTRLQLANVRSAAALRGGSSSSETDKTVKRVERDLAAIVRALDDIVPRGNQQQRRGRDDLPPRPPLQEKAAEHHRAEEPPALVDYDENVSWSPAAASSPTKQAAPTSPYSVEPRMSNQVVARHFDQFRKRVEPGLQEVIGGEPRQRNRAATAGAQGRASRREILFAKQPAYVVAPPNSRASVDVAPPPPQTRLQHHSNNTLSQQQQQHQHQQQQRPRTADVPLSFVIDDKAMPGGGGIAQRQPKEPPDVVDAAPAAPERRRPRSAVRRRGSYEGAAPHGQDFLKRHDVDGSAAQPGDRPRATTAVPGARRADGSPPPWAPEVVIPAKSITAAPPAWRRQPAERTASTDARLARLRARGATRAAAAAKRYLANADTTPDAPEVDHAPATPNHAT